MAKYLKVILISVFLLSVIFLSAPAARALTISEIQAQINAISAQITALLSQIAAINASSTAGCKSSWWIDNADTSCLYQKQFCGTYMYQGLQTFNSMHDCQIAASLKKMSCAPSWKCDWGPCESGYQPYISVDSNNCGLPITQANITCPFSTQQCSVSESPLKLTFVSANADILEYGLSDYIATGAITFKVKLSSGTMQKFTSVGSYLDKTKLMVVLNAYDSNGNVINRDNTYRYITQTPSKDLAGGEEATITVQQTLNFSSRDQIKSIKFKIDSVNYGVNNVSSVYTDTGTWVTNLASLPAISQARLKLMANITEAIKNISQAVSQLFGR